MGKRILVVDDEPVVLDAVSKTLRKTDCRVETAESAEDALKILADGSFDVVITDLMMPGMDGLALMQHLRDAGEEARTIMLTGYPTVRTALKAKKLGAFEYVTKPFTRQELLSVVLRALRKGTSSPGAAPSRVPTGQAGNTYFIPEHSWARLEPGGSARIGMARTFAATVGVITSLELPAKNDIVQQGRVFVVVRTKDGVEHGLHSPLSGSVTEINEGVVNNTDLVLRDPEGAGWLLQLEARNPKREIENLELAPSSRKP